MKRYITSCPIDNDKNFETTRLSFPEGALLKCKTCGQLISQCSLEHYNSTMEEFNDPKGTKPNSKSVKRAFILHSKRLNLIKKILNKNPEEISLLDVGCSSGAFLESAQKLNFKTYGVEPAEEAAHTAIQNGLNVKVGTLEKNAFQSSFFDVVTLFEVIEHLKNPTSLLNEIYRILKPKGFLVIGTGNTDSLTVKILKSNWEYFDIKKHGGHVSFFNPNSMKILAMNTGFNVYKIITNNVKLCEKEYHSNNEKNKLRQNRIQYKFLKLLSEALKMPTRLLGQGHDMLAILQKPRVLQGVKSRLDELVNL